MPQGVNPLKPKNPFTGQAVSTQGVKTAAQRAKEVAAAAARQRALTLQQNQYYAPQAAGPAPDPFVFAGKTTSPSFPSSSGSQTPGAQAAIRAAAGQTAAPSGTPPNNPTTSTLQQMGVMDPSFPTGSGYQAQTALGKSYRDLMLPSAWEDPEALIDTFYRVGGLDKGSGDYGTQLESADNLGILYMALMGEGANQGNANFVDWASHYLSDQRRADGRSLAPREIWEAIVDPSANSPLSYYLNNPTLTPEDQVNNFMSTMRYGMESTLPAPILNALMAQVDQMGREFRSLRNTQAGNASFTEYLQSRPGSLPWGVLGGL